MPIDVRSVEDFDAALAPDAERFIPALMMTTNDPLQQLHMEKIIAFQARNRLPGMFQARENVVAGGLMSYGASLPNLFQARRRLCAPHPDRHQACRSAGRAADHFPARGQPPDRRGARADDTGISSCCAPTR